jgi:hypothetical protein
MTAEIDRAIAALAPSKTISLRRIERSLNLIIDGNFSYSGEVSHLETGARQWTVANGKARPFQQKQAVT